MKLKEYFDKKREFNVSTGDKLEIYQKIISKRNPKSLYPKRQFFLIKSFAYSLVLGFLILGLYGTYIFNGKFIINKDGFFIQRSNGSQSVQADYIAKIIEFNGNFYIGHNGEYYQGTYISDGDVVTLQKGTELVFHIDKGTEAKVIGPAKFSITKGQNYRLNLIEGDFIQLKSLELNNPQNIEFYTKNLLVKQADIQKPINFSFIKDGEQTLLKNNGPQLIITQTNHEKQEIQKSLNSDNILAIQENDISIINDEKLSQAISQGDISQTLSFNNTEINNDQDLEQIVSQEYSQDNQETINKIGLPNDKSIPTEEQLSKLRSNLSETLVSRDISNIQKKYSESNDTINENISNLESKIKQIYISFNIGYTKVDGSSSLEKISQLKSNISKLISVLQEKYHIPPTYIDGLNSIIKQLSNIQ